MKKLIIILLVMVSIHGFGVDPLKPINWTGVRVSVSELIINGDSVKSDDPTTGQVLKFDGSKWAKGNEVYIADSSNIKTSIRSWNGSLAKTIDTGDTTRWAAAGIERDSIIGNEVKDVTNATLTRSGSGTTISPYTLGLNLGNANTWTATQTFPAIAAQGAIFISSINASGNTISANHIPNSAITYARMQDVSTGARVLGRTFGAGSGAVTEVQLTNANTVSTLVFRDASGDFSAGAVTATQFKLSALNTAPASAGATGTLGEIRIVDGYIYVCTATNTWKRAAIVTWP
jgi:hypothetical protein